MKRFLCLILCAFLLASPALAVSNGGEIVYITRTGECYHTGDCVYLSKSKIEITLSDAVARGYRACSVCRPPQLAEYAPDTPAPSAAPQTAPAAKPRKAPDGITAAYAAAHNAETASAPEPEPAAAASPETEKVSSPTAALTAVFLLGGMSVPLLRKRRRSGKYKK